MVVYTPVINMDIGMQWVDSGSPKGSESSEASAASTESAANLALTSNADTKVRDYNPEPSVAPDPTQSTDQFLPGSIPATSMDTELTITGLTYIPSDTSSSTSETWNPSTSTGNSTTFSQLFSTTSTTTSPIPTSTASQVTTTSTTTTATHDPTSDTSDPGTFSGGPSNKTKIAIAVPVSIIGLALLLALIFFLIRRRRRTKDRNSLPPPYHIAAGQMTAVSTQQLMNPTEPRSTTALSLPIPLISVSPSTESRGRSPSQSFMRYSHSPGSGASQAELGVAVAVPVDHRLSATEKQLGRASRHLARMPFEDFEDDEVGVGPVARGVDDDAVSDVSDGERRGRRREFDEVSDVSSFNDELSPVSPRSLEERRFR